MTQIFKTVLSLSLSGAILISVLMFGVRLLKGRLGRQWQYYIWLIVVLRLLLPFGPETSLMGRAYQAADRATARMMQERRLNRQDTEQLSEQNTKLSERQNYEKDTELSFGQSGGQSADRNLTREEPRFSNQNREVSIVSFLSAGMIPAGKYIWVIWLTVAFGMLIRKISAYQIYIKYVKAGSEPVCDLVLLNRLAVVADKLGIGRAVELCVNPLVASSMLVGYFRPCIILPGADVSEKEFGWIVMHELTHYRRRDIWYKWLVQITVCLHWFNPFVHIMSREIDRACEFACDEAVVAKMGYNYAAEYGETLLNAMAAGGTYREPIAAMTMSANKELLRERLGAIMYVKKKTKKAGMITAGLTVCIAMGALFIGVYPASASEPDRAEMAAGDGISVREAADDSAKAHVDTGVAAQNETQAGKEAAWAEAERYYKARSFPMFYIAFGELEEKEQEMWLDRIYADGDLSFFSVSVRRLDADSPLIQNFAQRFYEEDDVAFFSVLADEIMSEEMLEGWLDQALSDQKWNFQSMFYDKLNREEEKDELEKAKEEEQREAYRSVGVTWNGKNCYYKEQLVRIFLDIHMPNQSFYTLDMNPAGTVDIRIVRATDGQITGVAYMTEAEVEELFGDMGENDAAADETEAKSEADAVGVEFPRKMTVIMPVCNIREGAGAEYKVVGLLGEGEIVTALGKKEDADGRMWYLLDQESLSEKVDAFVKECYIRGDLVEEE